MKPARRGAGARVARASAAENERRPAPGPRSPPLGLRLPPPPDAPGARPAAARLRAPPSAASHAPFRPGARGRSVARRARSGAQGTPRLGLRSGRDLFACLLAIFVSCQLLSQKNCGKAKCLSSPRQNKCLLGLADLLKSKELRRKMKERRVIGICQDVKTGEDQTS